MHRHDPLRWHTNWFRTHLCSHGLNRSAAQMGCNSMCNMHVHKEGLCELALTMGAGTGPARSGRGRGMRGVQGGARRAHALHGEWQAHRSGAERAPARTPSVEPEVAVTRTSSQSAETTETILRDRHGAYQAEERRGNGFRRVVSGVGGVLRMTREAADAAVQRVKRFYFRDEG